jgi:hypothetical protein
MAPPSGARVVINDEPGNQVRARNAGIIQAMHNSNPRVLTTEIEYIRHMLFAFFPRATRRILAGEFWPFAQIIVVVLSTATTLLAYSASRISSILRKERLPHRDKEDAIHS